MLKDIAETAVGPIGKARMIGLLLGPLIFAVVLLLPLPEGMNVEAKQAIAVALLMICWWVTEAIPLPATALLPILLFPLLDILPVRDMTQPFANPVIFLFLGGFLIALAMEKWHLHERIALTIVGVMGARADTIIAGFMIATAFLSMWISNTATVIMMVPIALSVVKLLMFQQEDKPEVDVNHFATAMMLGIAYAASIGGMATLIGTPPNAMIAGFLEEGYGYTINFADWMKVALPLSLMLLLCAWLLLVKILFRNHLNKIRGAEGVLHDELDKLGPMKRGEKTVLVVFLLVAFLWTFRGLMTPYIPLLGNLSDAGVAILGAIILFLTPVDIKNGKFVLSVRDFGNLPWGILILFGGGLSLAAGLQASGFVEYVGGEIAAGHKIPLLWLLIGVVFSILVLTEFMTNIATITAFAPIIAAVALGMGENPLILLIPTTFAASCAFMLPVATAPNAIVFGSGNVRIIQMINAGLWMNLIAITLITLLSYSLMENVFNIVPGVIPEWAQNYTME